MMFTQSISAPLWLHRTARLAVSIVAMTSAAACHGLLDVSDPTLVQDTDIENPAGANARRLDAVVAFNQAGAPLAMNVGIFTDELTLDVSVTAARGNVFYTALDRRDSQGYETLGTGFGSNDPQLGGWDIIVTKAAIAIPNIRAYSPDSVRGDYLAQMYAMRGYAILQMAEDVCSGFPINDVVDNLPVYGAPMSTDSAIAYAITQLDSALGYVHDSTRFLRLARLTKGRALLDLGQYAEAATIVADIPTDFQYLNDGIGASSPFYGINFYWDDQSTLRTAVGDGEGTNGLPFVTAHDLRVPSTGQATWFRYPTDSLYAQQKYATPTAPFVISTGIEARLIQAEAALKTGTGDWLAILDTLRATAFTTPLGELSDPVDPDQRVDLVYKERAFWLYLTGRRLGDLRRLLRNYSRASEDVFPKGLHKGTGSQYATGTAIPFFAGVEGRFNPRVTGCTTR